MSAPSEKFIESWQSVRERGFWRFLGSRMPLVFTVVFGLLSYLLDHLVLDRDVGIVRIILNALVAGLLFALLMWFLNERRYRRAITGVA